MSFNGKILARNEQMDRRFMFMKIFWAQRVACSCHGGIYMCMTIIFKHLFLLNHLANQSQTVYGAFLGRVNESLYNWSRPHMGLNLGMKHQAMELYKVCINHDPGMTLTFFTAKST